MYLQAIIFLTIFYLIINTACGYKLKYKKNFELSVKENIENIMPLFDSVVYLCITSNNDDILNMFLDCTTHKNKTISLIELGKSYDFCDTVIVFDYNMTGCKNISVKRDKSLFFLNYKLNLQLKTLENCLVGSALYEIVSVSLAEGVSYRLHSDGSPTRYFKRSSVEEIQELRLRVKKSNLKGREIKIAYDPNPPYVIVTQDQNQTDVLDGLEFQLLKELSLQLNFSIKFTRYKDWGTLSSKGRWENGLIEAVVNGEAEIALSAIWMVKTMYNSLDFAPSLNRVKIGFLVRRPEPIEFQWKNLLAIFQPEVWIIILVSFTLVIVVYWAGVDLGGQQRACWTGCFLTILGLTIQTSFPRRNINRFVCYILTSWSFFSLLLTTILSGNVFCGLTLPQYSSRVDTIQQLVQGDFYWTVQYYARFNSSDMKRDIFNFKNPWVRRFEKRYKYLTSEQVREKAFDDKKVAFLIESFGSDLVFLDIGGLEGHEALRDFRMMKEEVTSTHLTFGIAKNSDLLEPITTMTLKLQEAGMNVRWRDRVLRRWTIYNTRHLLIETDITSFSEPHELALKKLQPVFFLLLFGLATACVVFALEVIW